MTGLTKQSVKAALITERKQLLSLVGGLSEEQFNAPSLCEGWTNRNVIGHIIGFELDWFDFVKLLFKFKALDDITTDQAKRYEAKTRVDYLRLLKKGHRRTLVLLKLTPKWLWNVKLLKVANGRLSPAQLFGDIVIDRAIHYFDISQPLGLDSRINESVVMEVALSFVLASIDLLNAKLPARFFGSNIHFNLTGLASAICYWQIGTSMVGSDQGGKPNILTIEADTNDFLFQLTGRERLITNPIKVFGDSELEACIRASLTANALWEA